MRTYIYTCTYTLPPTYTTYPPTRTHTLVLSQKTYKRYQAYKFLKWVISRSEGLSPTWGQ